MEVQEFFTAQLKQYELLINAHMEETLHVKSAILLAVPLIGFIVILEMYLFQDLLIQYRRLREFLYKYDYVILLFLSFTISLSLCSISKYLFETRQKMESQHVLICNQTLLFETYSQNELNQNLVNSRCQSWFVSTIFFPLSQKILKASILFAYCYCIFIAICLLKSPYHLYSIIVRFDILNIPSFLCLTSCWALWMHWAASLGRSTASLVVEGVEWCHEFEEKLHLIPRYCRSHFHHLAASAENISGVSHLSCLIVLFCLIYCTYLYREVISENRFFRERYLSFRLKQEKTIQRTIILLDVLRGYDPNNTVRIVESYIQK